MQSLASSLIGLTLFVLINFFSTNTSAFVTGTLTLNTTAASSSERTRGSCRQVNEDSNKIVCVCSEQVCDDLEFNWPTIPGHVSIVDTSRDGHRFRVRLLANAVLHKSIIPTCPVWAKTHNQIIVDIGQERQTILGWGGAFTDAAAINIKSLSAKMTERLIESYFGAKGLQYNFGRVPIAGSDFSKRAYSYDDSPEPDLNLTNWTLAQEDLEFKIPLLKEAIRVAKESCNTKLKLFASPWSPPKWMKTNNNFSRGHLINSDDVYQCYANYLIKFYANYREQGIEFWGATVQNEPMAAYLPFYFFNSLQMSAAEQIKFVSQYLGPALRRFGYTKETFKLMIGDDSLGFINHQVPTIMKNEQVQEYISGLAFHWYLSGSVVPYDALSRVVQELGSKVEFVMMSEACHGGFPSRKHVDLGDWHRGESYASDIIEDLKRRTSAWIDWNLALDLNGGPNWSGNFVDSPIIVDKEKNEFLKQPMYYVLAQYTRFFRPTSVIVDSSVTTGNYFAPKQSVIAAHIKETGHIVVIILNKSNDAKKFSVKVNENKTLLYTIESVDLEPKSVSTIVLKL